MSFKRNSMNPSFKKFLCGNEEREYLGVTGSARCRLLMASILAVGLVVGVAATPAQADILTLSTGSGDPNFDPTLPDVDVDPNVFDAGGDVFIGTNGFTTVVVTPGATNSELTADGLSLGLVGPDGTMGTLSVEGLGAVVNVRGFMVPEPPRRGITVGESSVGNLVVQDGGIVNVGIDLDPPDHSVVGAAAGGTGRILVKNLGSALNMTGSLFIGFDVGASGGLTVLDGGEVTVDQLSVGASKIGTGTVLLEGATSKITVNGIFLLDHNTSNGLEIGVEGVGSLLIGNGATLQAGSIDSPAFCCNHFIANAAGSSGEVTVRGTDSTLNMNFTDLGTGTQLAFGRLSVGSAGTDDHFGVPDSHGSGTLNIQEGGRVEVSTLGVAVASNARGIVNISNGGILDVTGGCCNGIAPSRTTVGAVGIVNVSGPTSQMNVTGVNEDPSNTGNNGFGPFWNIARGIDSHGELNVMDGAHVLFDPVVTLAPGFEGAGFSLARNAHSTGIVNVKGLGSEIRVRGSKSGVTIGRGTDGVPATAFMTITDGGKFIMEDTDDTHLFMIARRAGVVATVHVEGVGSELTAGNQLCVGLQEDCLTPAGIGTLIVANGAVVNANELKVGPDGLVTGGGTIPPVINVSGATFVNGGTIKPLGRLIVNGSFVQEPGGTLVLEVNGTADGEFDQLVINGSATIEGNITLVVGDDADLQEGDTVEFVVGDIESIDATLTVTDNDPITPDSEVDLLVTSTSTDGLGGIMIEVLAGGAIEVDFADLFVVDIDIKPGSAENTINLGSGGVFPVAVLSRPASGEVQAFDATQVDPLSLRLSNAGVFSGVRLKGNGSPQASVRDVNGDGLDDLLVHIETSVVEIAEDMLAVLRGNMTDGTPIRGTDSVTIVP